MKMWAKVLAIIGVVWIILVLVFLLVLYLNIKQIANSSNNGTLNVNSNTQSFLSTIDLRSPIKSLFEWFIVLILPSIVLFILAGIWGR